MPRPESGAEFMELVERSNVFAPSLLNQLHIQIDSLSPQRRNVRGLARAMVDAKILTRFQAHQLLNGRYKKFYLGQYKLLELLDVDSVGKTYVAEHLVTQRLVTLKTLRAGDGPQPDLRPLLTADLQHPNVLKVFEESIADGRRYLVGEFFEGIGLRHLLSLTGTIEWPQAVDFTAQAARGLQALHEAELVHGQLCLSRLGVDTEGIVRIDASMARSTAPVAAGMARVATSPDAVNDVRQLAAILLTLLTGRTRFDPEILRARWLSPNETQVLQILRCTDSSIPEEIVSMLHETVQHSSDRMFRCAMDMERALQPFCEAAHPPFDLSFVPFSCRSLQPFLRRSPPLSMLAEVDSDQLPDPVVAVP